MPGLRFNAKHNDEFELILEKKQILPPRKKKIKVDIPFMNGAYDFSTVATNGEQVYGERPIQAIFSIPSKSTEELYILYSKVLMWLQDTGKQQLIFDDIPDYYFNAEVEEISNFEEILNFGRITITFIADPFKKGINEVGNEAWDTFNFEVDYMQDVEYDLSGSKTITLYNPGHIVAPLVNCTGSMTVTNNGYTANFIAGDNKDWRLKLQPGVNTLSVNGTGHIKFIFRKEVL